MFEFNAYNQLCYSTGTLASSQSNLSCAANPPSGATTYSYDGDGLRVSDSAGPSGNQNFVYDTQTRSGQPLLVEDGTFAYLYGPVLFDGSAPLEQIELSNAKASFIASAPSGVAEEFKSNGTVLGTESYTAYGKPTVTGTIDTPFGFDGGSTDPDGLIYMINRYYDPTTGQFMSVDPDAALTGQPYAAFGDNPINATDSRTLRGELRRPWRLSHRGNGKRRR